ncbi:MAG: hypothetical protein KBT11_10035 [Treponema sp.]|nr:hypothetical protein [Candidatus Treponema equifaecale]
MESKSIKIEDIKNKAESENYQNWNEVIQDLRFLDNAKTEDIDTLLMISLCNLSLKKGLSVESDKETYLYVLEQLASFHSQTGEYAKAAVDFQSILDIRPDSPSWIKYSLFKADLHTNTLRRLLKKPKSFISFFDDDLKEEDIDIQTRQKNFLKDLFRCAADYRFANKDAEINTVELSEIAEKYGLDSSIDYKSFEASTKGENPEDVVKKQLDFEYKKLFEKKKAENTELSEENASLISKNSTLCNKNSQLEIENTQKAKQIEELLKVQKEISQKVLEERKAAEKSQKNLEKIIEAKAKDDAQMNSILLQSQKSFEETQQIMKEKDEENQKLTELVKALQDQLILKTKELDDEKLKVSEPKEIQPKPTSAYMVVAEYIQICTDILCVWLKTGLLCGNKQSAWNRFVVPYLKSVDIEKHSINSIEDVDFSTMCYVCNKNKSILGQQFFEIGQYQNSMVFQNMIEVRKRFAHYSQGVSDSVYLNDLEYIKQFLSVLDCDFSIRHKLDMYINDLRK